MIWDPKAAKVVGLAGVGRVAARADLATVRAPREERGAAAARRASPSRCRARSTPGGRCTSATASCRGRSCSSPRSAMPRKARPSPTSSLTTSAAAWRRSGGRATASRRPPTRCAPTASPTARGRPRARCSATPTSRAPIARSRRAGATRSTQGDIARAIDRYFKRIGGWLPLRGPGRAPGGMDRAAPHRLSRRHRPCARRQHAGHRDAADAQHARAFRPGGAGFQSARSIHLQAEAKRLAYEDRARYYADPNFAKVPVEWLVSKDYAAERAQADPPRPDPDRRSIPARRPAAATPPISAAPTRTA